MKLVGFLLVVSALSLSCAVKTGPTTITTKYGEFQCDAGAIYALDRVECHQRPTSPNLISPNKIYIRWGDIELSRGDGETN